MELDLMSQRIRKAGVFPFTENAMLGAWMPSMLNDRLVESAFLYTTSNVLDGKMARPFAWLTVDSQSGSVVRFEYCSNCDFMDTGKYPLDMKIPAVKTPLQQRMEAGKKFKEAYVNCRDFFFAPVSELTEEQVSSLKELKQCMNDALRPELKEFYDILGNTFFEWLEEV